MKSSEIFREEKTGNIMDLSGFDWGDVTHKFKEFITYEFFTDTQNVYETLYPVQEGDIVLDIGASIGPFTWSVMGKAKTVIALEPSKDIYPTLVKNCKADNTILLNSGLGKWDDNGLLQMVWDENGEQHNAVETASEIICLETLCNRYNLDKIDYIKTDCEGGEYSLFTDKNINFLKNNVRNICGEFHLRHPGNRVEFRYFRDKYLSQFQNFEVFSIDGIDIKWDLWNEHFIEYYNEVIIYINNKSNEI